MKKYADIPKEAAQPMTREEYEQYLLIRQIVNSKATTHPHKSE